MTPEQKLDRLERMARLLYEAVLADSREFRKQTAKLKDYWAALSEHDAAKLAVAERPEDLETSETLGRVTENSTKLAKNLNFRPNMNYVTCQTEIDLNFSKTRP